MATRVMCLMTLLDDTHDSRGGPSDVSVMSVRIYSYYSPGWELIRWRTHA